MLAVFELDKSGIRLILVTKENFSDLVVVTYSARHLVGHVSPQIPIHGCSHGRSLVQG